MKVDIWSDVRCPFCYIGKHKFEKALNEFTHKNEIKVQWHSFELDRNLVTNPKVNAVEHLAEIKGIDVEQMRKMMQHAKNAGREVGLPMNFEKGIVANSFNAHRLIQMAKDNGLANTAEELLFKAHFEEGKNIDDSPTLIKIGKNIGLREKRVADMLQSNLYADRVKADEVRAQQLGIQGVPYFIFNDKYAISGAQHPELFLQALQKSWSQFITVDKITPIKGEGSSCDIEGNCN